MTQQDTRCPFFVAALGMVGLLLCFSFSLVFLVPRLGPVPAFSIGIVLAMFIALLALISRLRGEPPRLRALFLIILMILSMTWSIVSMFLWE